MGNMKLNIQLPGAYARAHDLASGGCAAGMVRGRENGKENLALTKPDRNSLSATPSLSCSLMVSPAQAKAVVPVSRKTNRILFLMMYSFFYLLLPRIYLRS